VTIAGQTVTYAVATAATGTGLYSVEPEAAAPVGWAGLATLLQELWTGSGSAQVAPVHAARSVLPPLLDPAVIDPAPTARGMTQAYTGGEQQIATLCDDSPNPRDPGSYADQAAFAFARSGAFGPFRAWAAEPCAQWPAFDADRYAGPWNAPTASPLLIVGNTIDPGTPYQGSLAMTHDLGRARLLTVDGYGHTVFLNPSSCAQAYESAYLIDGSLPPAGATCQPDRLPFS
jgi:hypothetical protein